MTMNTNYDHPTPTLADALSTVAAWDDLSAVRREGLASALNSVARFIGMGANDIELKPDNLRPKLLARPAAAFYVDTATYRTNLSALRFVMSRLGLIDPSDTPLMKDWDDLLGVLDSHSRATLIALARFCSARGITPEQVTAETFSDFVIWLADRTFTVNPRKLAGRARGFWNKCCADLSAWRDSKVASPRQEGQFILPLETFTPEFQEAVAEFGRRAASTALDDRDGDDDVADDRDPGRDVEPLEPSTIPTRQGHLRWAASAEVASGTAIAEINALGDLVVPLTRAQDALRFLYQRNGGKPSHVATKVAEVLLIIARHIARLSQADLQRLARWAKAVTIKYNGMTMKNQIRIREVSDPARDARLLELPEAFLNAARRLRDKDPERAASAAMRGVVIQFLTSIPIRLNNLIGLRLDLHLQRKDPAGSRFSYLFIPAHEMKNDTDLLMPIGTEVADYLAEWCQVFRPILAQPGCPFLFPGHVAADRPITPQGMRDAVKQATRDHVGVELSPHQFRHLAAHRYLAIFPGQYEVVRQFLGHRSLTTTVRAYAGMETETSARRFDALVLNQRQSLKRATAETGSSPSSRRSVPPLSSSTTPSPEA
jgi:integrase